MKSQMCIFNKLLSVVSVMAVLGLMMPAHAVIDNTGCDDENNLYVNPDLALCSTHVYNIGLTENPNDSAHKQMIKDVVALKTTLITQQMYSQYEILETTVKRLKTQLEKQVLLDRLKAASASANGGSTNDPASGNSSGSDKYIVLPNAENCLDISGGSPAGLNCLIRNLDKVVVAVSSDTGKAKKQLQKDLEVADMYSVIILDSDGKKVLASKNIQECQDLSKRDSVSACARKLRIAVNNNLEEAQRKNSQSRNQGGWGQ